MPRVEKGPPRDDAEPTPTTSRAPWTREQPARARADAPPAGPAGAARLRSSLGLLWVLALGATTGGLIALHVLAEQGAEDTGPDLLRQGLGVLMGVLLALGLSTRSGGRPLPAAGLALVLGGVALATQWPALLAGAAVATGVLAACLAVLGTAPAASFVQVVREVVLAQLVATAGAFGVVAYAAPLDAGRLGYTVLGLCLVATIALVYRLGAGLHGLGGRGAVVALVGLGLLAIALAYTAALARWGSPGMTDQVDSLRFAVHDLLGAVPHPIEALVGIPALAYGVRMRDRRRQGWWVCAFGTAATAPAATRLVDAGTAPGTAALGAAYSLVLGLLIAFVALRVETRLRGGRGRRALRDEEPAHRPEPPRLLPLH